MQPTLKIRAPPPLSDNVNKLRRATPKRGTIRARGGGPAPEIIMAIDSIDQENFTAW